MNRFHLFLAAAAALLLGGALGASQPVATAVDTPTTVITQAPDVQDGPNRSLEGPEAEALKRCSTNSDCPNSQCRDQQCGGCSTNSDCGYGQCRGGQCGACSTNSDCDGWGSCRDGQCGGCSTNSDCGSFGSCRSQRCERSPY